MKPRALLAVIFLAVLTALPTLASAAFVHYFDCSDCHRDGAAWNSVDAQGVCITCHDTAGSTFTFPRTRPDDGATSGVIPPGFATGDASNIFGNGNNPLAQDSHNWGANDSNPAAGASPASSAMYNTRRGAANGFVACYKCHDPHTYYDADYLTGNEKMLRTASLPGGDGTSQNTEQNVEAMCTECHLDWASVVSADRGFKSHPMYASDYETFAAGDVRFKSFVPTGNMKLLAGNTIGCSTCHGLHKTDSGGAQDGALLKAAGPSVDDLAVCVACHEYKSHPSSTGTATQIGCLVCHSGHSYNSGTPNYFVLRDEVNVPAGTSLPTQGTTVTGLRFTDLPPADGGTTPINELYAGPNGNDGFCTGCHGDITSNAPGYPSEIQTHTGAEDCSQCHSHYDPSNPGDGSFVGKGCNGCHGYPPRQNVAGGDPNAGWASDLTGTGHDYQTNNGSATFKDESQTPHNTHAGTNPIAATIDCKTCHNAHLDDFNGQHNNATTGPTFQNVLEAAYTMPSLPSNGGTLTPTYATAGAGTCSAIYCHSNGNQVNLAANTIAVSWENGNGTINDCSSCHDDNTTNIGVGTKNNTAAHNAHVTRYAAVSGAMSCNLCHVDTTDGTIIDTPANHVNGTVQFATDANFVLDTGSGAILGGSAGGPASCAVYCHSDGNGNFSNPSWTGTAVCGSCHSIDPATIDTIQGGGAHFRHLSDPNGPQIANCNTCHTHDGTFAPNNGHIDKSTLVKANACDACHGRPAGGWVAAPSVDESPVWTDSTTVRCDTCHSGTVSVIGVSAPYVDETAYGNGHGKVGVAQSCTACHEAATVPNHLGGTTIDRTIAALGYVATDDRAFCTACHVATTNNHSTIDGTVCKTCHTQHGENNGFDAMVMSNVAGNTVTGFTTQGVRTSYANAAFTGICQTCHTPWDGVTGIKHFNKTTNDQTHNAGSACSDCHQHSTTPAFKGTATTCGGCHSDEMVAYGHPAHVQKNSASNIIEDDLSDCARCHGADVVDGIDPYTLTGGGNGKHQNAVVDFEPTLGYNDNGTPVDKTDDTCTGACHASAAADGFWGDTALNCTACHNNSGVNDGVLNNAAPGVTHQTHLTASYTCDNCHDAGTAIPTDTTHIDSFVDTALLVDSDAAILTDMATAGTGEATVDDSSFNGGTPSYNSGTNSCSNSDCHNPSGDGHSAQWAVDTANCVLCHGGVLASADPIGSNAHGSHVNNAAVIGDNIDCFQCHVDTTAGGTNMNHRNANVDIINNVDVNIGLGYTGDTAVGAPYGTCNSKVCHLEGGNGSDNSAASPIASPIWTTTGSDCTICHTTPPPSGDHSGHWVAGRIALGLSCVSCHGDTAASNSSIKAGSKHLNSAWIDFVSSGNYDGSIVTVGIYDSAASPSTCSSVSCHFDNNPRSWAAPNTCESCHGDLTYIGGAHAPHTIGVTGSPGDIENDVSECVICHGVEVNSYTYTASGNHQNGTIQTEAGIGTAASGCASACHGSSSSDGFWTDADNLNCTACHNNGTNDNNIANAAPATGKHANHVTTQSMTCDNCHDASTAIPTNTTHISGLGATGLPGADQGETLTNKATPVADNATVDDRSFDHAGNTFDDAANSCSNTYCHDPSNNTTVASWDTDIVSCNLCHGFDRTSVAEMATGSHSNHLNAITKFGLATLEDCLACHPDNVGSNGHFITGTGPTTVNQSVVIAGTVIDGTIYSYSGEVGLPSSAFGTCGTTPCHNNGQGVAPVSAYTWATPLANDCNTCHSERPTTLSHNIHTGATVYGPHPTGSTNCGECHAANANNTTMAGQSAHINGSRNYNDGNSVLNHGGIFGVGNGIVGDTTVTVCNNCHGGQASADSMAKNNWPSNTNVGCESCHGDYTLANSQQDGLGATAPNKAGTDYTTWGHGKASTPASAVGGSLPVVQACTDCHDAVAAGHIDGISGNATRLNVIGGADFDINPNGFCNACHTGVANSGVHFDNNTTPGGTSDDGTQCVICHNQHGQGGQQAMIDSTIAGHTVSGFTDRTARASYANVANQGVCQICHDPAEVTYFNRTTESLATHNAGGNCLDCHSHQDSTIFTPSGCSGCHGGGTIGATASNYWPDSSNVNPENSVGEHVKHVTVIAARLYDQTPAQILDDPASDAKQKSLCQYCHAADPNDSNHAGTVNRADVFVDFDGVRRAKNLWGLNDPTAAYNQTGDTCSGVECHNSQTTVATYNWYATPGPDNNADCVMCHTVGALNANPTTGLHDITNTATVQQHNDNLLANGCEECHAKPAFTSTSTHVDGVWVPESGVNTDRFLAPDVNFTEGAVNQTTCTPSAGLAGCHSDGGIWWRQWSTAADSTLETVGSARCDVCHGQLNNWRTGLTVDHNKTNINNGTHSSCETCHVQPNAPYSFASYHNTSSPVGAPSELGAPGRAIEFNSNAGYDMVANNCTNICHGTDAAHTLTSSNFPANGLLGPTPGCNTCHFDTGGGPAGNTVNGYTFSGAGSHPKHNTTSATTYGDTGLSSTTIQYNYGCANCHPIDSINHNNGTLNLTLNSTHGGPIKSRNGVADDVSGYSQTNGSNVTCSAAWCHSDGVGGFATTPNWWGGTFPAPLPDGTNDYCGNCHGNQPTSTSHAPHAVGIHFDDVYTGTSGLLTAAAATNAGHGDVTTAMTINCNVCHASTVNQWRNDHNTQCRACHAGEGNEITRNDASLLKNFHVNGVKDIAFSPVDPLRSKAQVRTFSATEPELNNNWSRINGYKVGATSHDASKNTPPLDTATMWNGATKNCTVVCHNGNTVAWGTTGVSCNNCHTQLPK